MDPDCQIGGLPPEEVDRCLERWMAAGILEMPQAQEAPEAEPPAGCRAASAEGGDELDASLEQWVDPRLDLPESLQRRILALDATLERRSYHQLLGVAWDDDSKAIKRAYFALSKEFHPDRYFRRQIGDYKPRLERVFKKIVEAYELMSDPTTRAELQRTLAPEALTPSTAAAEGGEPVLSTQRRRRELLDRLRRQFRIPEKVLAERRIKARTFYDASRVASARENWLEAAASVRLAIAFDPAENEYKRGFAEIQAQVHQVRARELQERADQALEAHDANEALRLYEEILHYRPGDGDAYRRASLVALEASDPDQALEYAEEACELEPDQPAHHVALGRVLRRLRDRDRARVALEKALELDPHHREAREELAALRRAARRR